MRCCRRDTALPRFSSAGASTTAWRTSSLMDQMKRVSRGSEKRSSTPTSFLGNRQPSGLGLRRQFSPEPPRRQHELQSPGERIETTCTGVYQSCYEVRHDLPLQCIDCDAMHIIFMTAPGCLTATVIHVTPGAHDLCSGHARSLSRRQQTGKNPVPRQNVSHDVPQIGAFWGANFRMRSAIDIELGTVLGENACGVKIG